MTKPLDFDSTEWVLVTGGSHGIGRALVLECIRRQLPVATVALPDGHLTNLEEELARLPDARYRLLGLDLVADGAIGRLRDWLRREGISVSYLINNAGFGRGGLFEHTPWSEYRRMIDLNNRVAVELIYSLLPALKRNRGGIMNLSSMEATLPLPYKTVYTGTKAFVYNLSLALREEFRYHGVSVTVLCPGPVITNEDGLRRVAAQGPRARLLVTMPEDIAPQAIDGLLEGRAVVRPGWLVRFLVGLSYVTPRPLRMRILERLFSRYREEEAPVAAPQRLEEPLPR